MDRHLEAIDGLRGIAIALVVAYHSWLAYGVNAGVFSQTGFLGVELFFALSGFCMFYPFARARFLGTSPPSWAHYAYRRGITIVPSYAHFPDGIHPIDGPRGYDAMARIWYDAIAGTLHSGEQVVVAPKHRKI